MIKQDFCLAFQAVTSLLPSRPLRAPSPPPVPEIGGLTPVAKPPQAIFSQSIRNFGIKELACRRILVFAHPGRKDENALRPLRLCNG